MVNGGKDLYSATWQFADVSGCYFSISIDLDIDVI